MLTTKYFCVIQLNCSRCCWNYKTHNFQTARECFTWEKPTRLLALRRWITEHRLNHYQWVRVARQTFIYIKMSQIITLIIYQTWPIIYFSYIMSHCMSVLGHMVMAVWTVAVGPLGAVNIMSVSWHICPMRNILSFCYGYEIYASTMTNKVNLNTCNSVCNVTAVFDMCADIPLPSLCVLLSSWKQKSSDPQRSFGDRENARATWCMSLCTREMLAILYHLEALTEFSSGMSKRESHALPRHAFRGKAWRQSSGSTTVDMDADEGPVNHRKLMICGQIL